MAKVAAIKAETYDEQVVELAMQTLLDELGGISEFIKPGDKVLIKPNMLEGLPPDKAVTTHPEIVRAMINQVKGAGGIPLVGDSPGVSSTLKVAEKCGILRVCQQEDVELIPFNDKVEVPFAQGTTVKKFVLAKAYSQVDKVISLAKMKTHSFMGVTGGVKNLFGLMVGTDKAQFHLRMKKRSDFAGMLVDLAQVVKPVLYIVDGIIGMEGHGPRNGKPKQANILLGGTNGFAVDLVMAEVMGYKGETMPVAAKALSLGLSPRMKDIEVVGSGRNIRLEFAKPRNLESLDNKLPAPVVDFFQNQLTARPVIVDCCIACGRCAAHCPPEAIRMMDNKAVIDYQKCIRCYCCQELCPADAVKLQNGLLLKLIRRWK
ncbi:DUF362 domain-containing protein [Pelosinus sp. IPA-1]|uniref:DUF362 domain-containing protein n=1 Tax=Pelosinus sp. IPA-1 TaxID=3029569 RepID=UPI0024361E75|nr:DUF362 domain-containing protein [Pelosinus sp. IPA-1]GMA98936.1 (4Fe-4S)-binding protein [Pelosinus sp. IPA-1]